MMHDAWAADMKLALGLPREDAVGILRRSLGRARRQGGDVFDWHRMQTLWVLGALAAEQGDVAARDRAIHRLAASLRRAPSHMPGVWFLPPCGRCAEEAPATRLAWLAVVCALRPSLESRASVESIAAEIGAHVPEYEHGLLRSGHGGARLA